LTKSFHNIEFIHLPRESNQFADALAKLSSLINIPNNMVEYPITIERRDEPAYINAIDTDTWFQPIIDFKKTGAYPPNTDKRAKRALRMLPAQYVIVQNELFKKTPQGDLLICIGKDDGYKIMEMVHDGDCGTHMNARMLWKKIIRLN
jgi:hypothetical protein